MKNYWKLVKIGDIGEVVGGGTPSTKCSDYYGGDIPWITPKDLSNFRNRYISRGERMISKLGLENSSARMLPPFSVLFTSRAPIGYIAIAKNELCTNQGFKSIIPDPKKCNALFLYYLLKYKKNDIELIANGSTFQEVSGTALKNFEVSIPPLDEQRKIAGILSALDDKIELNNKINRNLEAQAQAIFKSWFIDFEPFKNGRFIDSELGKIPEGWKVGNLSDIANITMGQSPNGNSYNEKKTGMIFFQGRAEFGWRFPRNRLYTTAPKRIAERDSVLLSIRAPVGDINKALERCCIGRGLATLTSNHKTFLYYKMQSIRHLLDVYNGEGTVFGSINKNTLQEIRTIIPIDSEIIRFELKLKVVDELIRNNYIENLRLMKLRNALLPELMSGKIDILRFSNR